jgi:hypothetical protein
MGWVTLGNLVHTFSDSTVDHFFPSEPSRGESNKKKRGQSRVRQATQVGRVPSAAAPERSRRSRGCRVGAKERSRRSHGRSEGAEQEKILSTEAARGLARSPLDLWRAVLGGRWRRRKKQRPRGGWRSGVLSCRSSAGHGGCRSGHTNSLAGKRMTKHEAWERMAATGRGRRFGALLLQRSVKVELHSKEWNRIVGLVRYFLLLYFP